MLHSVPESRQCGRARSELAFFAKTLAFFTTEHTEVRRRATEYCNNWG
jgi:hypothetical protein